MNFGNLFASPLSLFFLLKLFDLADQLGFLISVRTYFAVMGKCLLERLQPVEVTHLSVLVFLLG